MLFLLYFILPCALWCIYCNPYVIRRVQTAVLVHCDIYRVSRRECARLREEVPYIKVHRSNPKHLYPKLNGYGDNGERKVWSSCGCYPYTVHARPSVLQPSQAHSVFIYIYIYRCHLIWSRKIAGFQILTAKSLHIQVFWDATPYRHVSNYRRFSIYIFRGNQCMIHLSKCLWLFTSPHSTPQKASISTYNRSKRTSR